MKLYELNVMLSMYLKCEDKESCAVQGDKDCRWREKPNAALRQWKQCEDCRIFLGLIKHSQEVTHTAKEAQAKKDAIALMRHDITEFDPAEGPSETVLATIADGKIVEVVRTRCVASIYYRRCLPGGRRPEGFCTSIACPNNSGYKDVASGPEN